MIDGALGLSGILGQSATREILRGGPGYLRAIAGSLVQTALLAGSFMAMSLALGLGGPAIRGDLAIYLVTGILLFNVHARTITAVMGSEAGIAEARMHRAPSALVGLGAAMGSLYLQVLTAILLFGIYHLAIGPVDWAGLPACLPMVLLAWTGGIGIGLGLAGLRRCAPRLASHAAQAWIRTAMVTSGAMFVANALPGHVLPWLTWNPLFHAVDQARGAAFANYVPHVSDAGRVLIWAALALAAGAALRLATRYAQPAPIGS